MGHHSTNYDLLGGWTTPTRVGIDQPSGLQRKETLTIACCCPTSLMVTMQCKTSLIRLECQSDQNVQLVVSLYWLLSSSNLYIKIHPIMTTRILFASPIRSKNKSKLTAQLGSAELPEMARPNFLRSSRPRAGRSVGRRLFIEPSRNPGWVGKHILVHFSLGFPHGAPKIPRWKGSVCLPSGFWKKCLLQIMSLDWLKENSTGNVSQKQQTYMGFWKCSRWGKSSVYFLTFFRNPHLIIYKPMVSCQTIRGQPATMTKWWTPSTEDTRGDLGLINLHESRCQTSCRTINRGINCWRLAQQYCLMLVVKEPNGGFL